MGTKFQDTTYIPIGCSCIVQFQLNMLFGEDCYDSMLMDWNISTLDSSIKLLTNLECIASEGCHDLTIKNNNIILNNEYKFYYWHLQKQLGFNAEITDKLDVWLPKIQSFHSYLSSKFLNAIRGSGKKCFVWSNIQPNLKSAVQSVGCEFEDFFLTLAKYESLKLLLQSNSSNYKMVFVTRKEDCDFLVQEKDDVFLVDLARSRDYRGPHGLFEFLK